MLGVMPPSGGARQKGVARHPPAHTILAAAAIRTPGFQTVIFPGSPGCALYPSVNVT